MIPYYSYHRSVRFFDPAQEPLRTGDVVCCREQLRRVSSAQPLRLERPTGGGEPIERSEAVLLPEYSRRLPQRQVLAPAPRQGRPPPLDADQMCEQLGLEVGTLLQQARTEVDVDRFYRSAERKVLLQQGLGVQSSRELSWLLHLLEECSRSPPLRRRCFAALLLGRCLHHFRHLPEEAAAERSVGLLRRLLRPMPSAAASLAERWSEPQDEDDLIRSTFANLVRLAAPPPQYLQLRGTTLTIHEPDVCALKLEEVLRHLEEGPSRGASGLAAPAATPHASPGYRR